MDYVGYIFLVHMTGKWQPPYWLPGGVLQSCYTDTHWSLSANLASATITFQSSGANYYTFILLSKMYNSSQNLLFETTALSETQLKFNIILRVFGLKWKRVNLLLKIQRETVKITMNAWLHAKHFEALWLRNNLLFLPLLNISRPI